MLVLVLYIVIPALCLVGVRRRGNTENMLDLDATLTMRGLGMLLIVFTHMAAKFICSSTYFFWVSGTVGVAICFLVSGYGLHISYKNKDNYLHGFWIPKILRLLAPFVLSLATYWLRTCLEARAMSAKDLLESLITVTLPGTTLWYIKIQFLMYAAFFFAYRYFNKAKFKIAGVFIVAVCYILIAWATGLKLFWYNTCLFFPLGLLLAEYQAHVFPLLRKTWVAFMAFAVFASLYAVLHFFGRLNLDFLFESVYSLALCVVLLWLVQYFSGSYILKALGKYSMEVYLLHIVIGGIFPSDKPLSYIFTPAVSVLLGIPVHWVSGKVTHLLSKNRKQVK